MDRKSIVILALSFGLLMLWYPLVNRLYPPQPIPESELLAGSTNAPATPSAPGATSASAPAVSTPAAAAISAPLVETPWTRVERPEETLVLETDHARYVFTSHGGGIREVELKGYNETVGRQARKAGVEQQLAALNRGAPVPAFALLGDRELQDDGVYALERTAGGVRAEKTLTNGVRVVKEFLPGTNYLVAVSVRCENTSSEPVRLPPQELVIGTATPMNMRDNGMLLGVQWHDGRSAHWTDQAWFANRTLGCLPGTPRSVYVDGQTNIAWGAVHNRFFALVAVAPTNALVPQILSRKIDLDPPTPEQLSADRQAVAKPFGLQTGFLYPQVTLEPGRWIERRFDVFAGPKEYRTLDRLSSRLGQPLDLVMNFGFGGFFAKGLLLSMNAIHSLGISYGLTIVVITILIKLLFWWPTQASTRSMKRMQALQPQIKEIQQKYKDTPDKMNRKMMEFMKEHKVNPAAGCLPILIQLPVFIGFYKMLQSAIELRGAGFLWASDLSQPDTIWLIPVLGFPLNPLPIIMGLTQFWQMKLTPVSPTADPVQQKIFQYMPLFFLFILYNFSSGLTLYWTVQNLLTIAQTRLTKMTDEKTPAKIAAPQAQAPKKATQPTRKKK